MKKTFALLIIITILLSACQPTPEKQIVIQKDNYEGLVENTALPEQSIISDSSVVTDTANGNSRVYWQDVFSTEFTLEKDKEMFAQNDLTITVDADIVIANETASVYLVEPAEFGQDLAERATNYFFDGVYYNGLYNKDDWLLKILPMEKALVNMTDYSSGIQSVESYLRILKKYYTMAPESNTQGSLEFKQDRFSYICVKGYPYSGAVAELYVGNGGIQYTDFYYVVEDGQQTYEETTEEYTGVPANGMSKSYDEALKTASDAIYELFGSEMALVQTTLANKVFMDENYPITSRGYYDDFEQCYVFYFTPLYNGLPQLYAPEAQNKNDQRSGGEPIHQRGWDCEYSKKWPAEYTQVIVDDNGIIELWSFSPSKIVKEVNSNVQMLSFDEIFEIFKKNIFYSSVWVEGSSIKTDIDIDKIVFGLIRTPVKDNPNQFHMVPAWQFIGSKSSIARRPDEGFLSQLTDKVRKDMELLLQYADYHESGKTFMVLNALDGSIIDTSYFTNVQRELKKYIGFHKE